MPKSVTRWVIAPSKMHGWYDGDVAEESAVIRLLGQRLGDRMALMLDPACQIRTFADAVTIGRVCDEAGFRWYEDPFRDTGVSAFAHKRLREMIRTPLLITEHVRGLEAKADFVINGGTTSCGSIRNMISELLAPLRSHI